jgi:hypothetical protein
MDITIIQACKKQQREAQRLVYEKMATKLYYVCKRYLKKEEEIEEEEDAPKPAPKPVPVPEPEPEPVKKKVVRKTK